MRGLHRICSAASEDFICITKRSVMKISNRRTSSYTVKKYCLPISDSVWTSLTTLPRLLPVVLQHAPLGMLRQRYWTLNLVIGPATYSPLDAFLLRWSQDSTVTACPRSKSIGRKSVMANTALHGTGRPHPTGSHLCQNILTAANSNPSLIFYLRCWTPAD
ncbi:hypothetical protein BDW02DRAFT_136423 [Decorospora gaudefroyi]|uniref:Uncharacterized protein n=1 Tax=Decorospora gaudefroyi TaxID=184978 RepID=A0A6A5K0V6_9PLEO|nr:hypothetical protein BDW02DRAFT_136423 [Decorospora gaudefroyi]